MSTVGAVWVCPTMPASEKPACLGTTSWVACSATGSVLLCNRLALQIWYRLFEVQRVVWTVKSSKCQKKVFVSGIACGTLADIGIAMEIVNSSNLCIWETGCKDDSLCLKTEWCDTQSWKCQKKLFVGDACGTLSDQFCFGACEDFESMKCNNGVCGCVLKNILIIIIVYSFIKSQVTDRTCLQSKYKLYEIRPTGPARRLATR